MEQSSGCLHVEMYWLIFISFSVLLLGFLVWASAYIGSGVYVKSYCCAKCVDKSVALTFDDSPSPMTEKVLDVLKEHDVKASFFLIGQNIEKYPNILQRIVDEGHIVGNHSWAHTADFPTKTYAEVENEFKKTSALIYKLTGRQPLFFRPPFGVTNPRIGRAVRNLGMKCIGWNIRSLDTVEKYTREAVMSRIASQMKPGSVILLHDRCKDSDKLLQMVLQYINENGYKVVSIEELFNLKAYV